MLKWPLHHGTKPQKINKTKHENQIIRDSAHVFVMDLSQAGDAVQAQASGAAVWSQSAQ